MALVVPASGAITFSTLASVYGLSPPYKLSDLRKGGSYVPNTSDNANVKSIASNMNVSDYRNSSVEYKLTLSSNSTNYHLYNAFVALYTSLAIARKYVKLTINSGMTVGSNTTASPALDVGQFPTGTTISVVNNGAVYGAAGSAGSGGTVYGAVVGTGGGATNGGSGGDAIKANYSNQIVTITNNGTVYGGGGGGGGGGKGATGANGSGGSYTAYYDDNFQYSPNGTWYFFQEIYNYDEYAEPVGTLLDSSYYWAGQHNPGGNFVRGDLMRDDTIEFFGRYPVQLLQWSIGVRNYYTAYTSGGIGGTGGNGGSGAAGRGNNNLVAALTGFGGGGGSAGTAGGGAGATAGATGATGGSGGNGGNWGQSGNAGGGTNPGSGGSAGRYLLKGSATVTISGGTIGGLLA